MGGVGSSAGSNKAGVGLVWNPAVEGVVQGLPEAKSDTLSGRGRDSKSLRSDFGELGSVLMALSTGAKGFNFQCPPVSWLERLCGLNLAHGPHI